MPEKFIGAEVRAGNFTNDKGEVVNFNNLMMTFVKPGNLGCMVNDRAPLVKVKNTREDIFRVFGEMITVKWLQERLGWFADVFYDEKKKVAKIIFYGPQNPFDGSSSSAPAISNEGISGLTATSSSEEAGALSGMADFPGESVTSAEPAQLQPAHTEPAQSEPAHTEPAHTEPAHTEPARSEPAQSEPAQSEPAQSEPVHADSFLEKKGGKK